MTKLVRFYGDSTVAGSTIANTVRDLLNAKYGLGCVSVVNEGIGGSTMLEWYTGRAAAPNVSAMPSIGARVPTPAFQATDIFVHMAGINDVFIPTTTEDDYVWAANTIRKVITDAGKKFVAVTPNPINDPHNPALWAFQNKLKLSAEGWPANSRLVDNYNAVALSFPNWMTSIPDNIHPDSIQQAFTAALVAKRIEGFL